MQIATADGVSAVMTYCTNSHAGERLEQVVHACSTVFSVARQALESTDPLALGLWLSSTTVPELIEDTNARTEMRARLAGLGLYVPSLNAFPFGNFHADRLKQAVYEPGWWDTARRDYTIACGTILADLAQGTPASEPGHPAASISTVGFGNRSSATPEKLRAAFRHLGEVAAHFDRLRQETGIEIVLSLEPEPLTVLETTGGTIALMQELYSDADAIAAAGDEIALRRHVGLCLDACHQAVLWEDTGASFAAFRAAGIRVGKIQISNAIERPVDTDPQDALAEYAEPRFLHQVYAQPLAMRDGIPAEPPPEKVDLPEALADADWYREREWRCHFHVPIWADTLKGGLRTTRSSLHRLLGTLAEEARRDTGFSVPLLEVETYTWSVLPADAPQPFSRVEPSDTVDPSGTAPRGGPSDVAAELVDLRRVWTIS